MCVNYSFMLLIDDAQLLPHCATDTIHFKGGVKLHSDPQLQQFADQRGSRLDIFVRAEEHGVHVDVERPLSFDIQREITT